MADHLHRNAQIDEAHEYFDENVDDLLIEARKYKVGCVLAHQFLDQTTTYLRSSLASSTATKLASRLSVADARFLAPNMRTVPETLLTVPRLTFACYIRDATPEAVQVPVEAGKLEGQPRLSDDEYASFLDRNRERVSLVKETDSTVKRQPDQPTPPESPARHQGEQRPGAKPPPPSDEEDDYRL